jgi:transcriptional regulator with XRE-family HTH domain
MKLRLGQRLLTIRNDRQLTQAEMSDLIGVSQSAYSRIERNESSVDIEDVMRFSKILQVPVQEFLPETMSIHYENHQGQGGPNLIFGDYHYHGTTPELQELVRQLVTLTQSIVTKSI